MNYDDTIYWLRRDRMVRLAAARAAVRGCVGDLPHPYIPGASRCAVCFGPPERLMHNGPWYRPVFAPCPDCKPGDRDCTSCGGTRFGFERTGIEELPEPTPVKTFVRRWQPGSKRRWHRRKGRHKPKRARTALNRRDRHKIKAELRP